MRSWIRGSLWDVVPRDQRDPPDRRRRRRAVTAWFLVLGAVVLGLSLRIEPGSDWFYVATCGLAAVWTVGAFASGPLHLGRTALRGELVRPVLAPILLGLALAGGCVLGGLLVREVDWLEGQVSSVLDFADQGSLPILVLLTSVNGVAEELFFRGAAYAAISSHPVAWTTLAYALATAATGNLMLSFAALLLGVVVGLERRASGGILAPILTHVTWSLTLLFALPAVFAR